MKKSIVIFLQESKLNNQQRDITGLKPSMLTQKQKQKARAGYDRHFQEPGS